MRTSQTRTAFTLVELLVVMAIIAIVIALVLPALGGSRDAARAASTKSMLAKLSASVGVFGHDNGGKMPGYFTPREMGHSDNLAAGMSQSENALLDLAGFKKVQSGGITIGPSTGNTLQIDPDSLGLPGGTNDKLYFVPDRKQLVAQVMQTQQMATVNQNTAAEGDPQLPDLVDAWGTPILMWVPDTTHVAKPSGQNFRFASLLSGSGTGPAPGKYYWASNACFLTAKALGKKGMSQIPNGSNEPGGMLWENAPATETSLTALLGNPNAPYRNPQQLDAVPTWPLSARAPFIAHSAGRDGVYLGYKDKGAKQFAQGAPMTYGTNFAPNLTAPIGTGNQYLDKNGKPTNIDILADFDDIFAYGGT